MIFDSSGHQVWSPLYYDIKTTKFSILLGNGLWRIQIPKLCLSTFLHDESNDRGGDLQIRVLKIWQMPWCQKLKVYGKI